MPRQRFSRQREQIYQTVRGSKQHPAAKEVYDALKPLLPKLSLGTVYRDLGQMVEESRLAEIHGPVSRYDGNLTPHTHFRCILCGRVSDLESLPYDSALDSAAAGGGWRVLGHELVFTGICPACGENHNTTT